MKIIVCIKQVPATQKVAVDPVTGVLIRNGIETKMNPYDLYAIHLAISIKKQTKATVTAITMGPDSAIAVLNEAMALGCDHGVLISDRKFAGADVLATSYTLASVIQTIDKNVDLVIVGKQTTDGDTAQVGAELATHLDRPFIGLVKGWYGLTDDSIRLSTDQGHRYVDVTVKFPCVISVSEKVGQPDLPSYLKLSQVDLSAIQIIRFNDLGDQNSDHYGLSGSPTQVEKIFEPIHDVHHTVVDASPSACMDAFISTMVDNHWLAKENDHE